MIMVADGGSTKVDWQLIHPTWTKSVQTVGLNPYFVTHKERLEILKRTPFIADYSAIRAVYFYGAGCGTEEQQATMKSTFSQVFPKAIIHIMSDMLGAARATCGRKKGLICILGTGANACIYEANNIKVNAASNGIWLGDEGSGGHLGKKLITSYLNNDLPIEIKDLFEQNFPHRRAEILEHIYRKPFPNRYLAAFSPFIQEHIAHPYLKEMVAQAFDEFCTKMICKLPDYNQYPLHFVGSIAHHYRELLTTVLNKKGLSIQSIQRKPIEGLASYHEMELKKGKSE